ncbi:MAG: bifunctional adenosylcobinamide kinase/adenosylcobinamide-phosphate guanylyltransferase [Synechocystis sp.]|nr:bifunctional adenosylcobinamide kinase/adenosylcobinamide-phosphate guanylyltransferase [Synechocystis sp.]
MVIPSEPVSILVTGPSRSGKSEWAEHLALQMSESVIYIATGQENPDDPDWQARIDRHRQRRPDHWQTLCVSQNLSATLNSLPPPACVLVDSLGGWVANCLELSDPDWQSQQRSLLRILVDCPVSVILVAEETGWGVIPAYPLGRLFRDRLGSLIRQVGGQCQRVYLVTGGYALELSQWGERLPRENRKFS